MPPNNQRRPSPVLMTNQQLYDRIQEDLAELRVDFGKVAEGLWLNDQTFDSNFLNLRDTLAAVVQLLTDKGSVTLEEIAVMVAEFKAKREAAAEAEANAPPPILTPEEAAEENTRVFGG